MNSYKISGKFLIDNKEVVIKDKDAVTVYAVDSKQADSVVTSHLLDKHEGENLEWLIKYTVLNQVGRNE